MVRKLRNINVDKKKDLDGNNVETVKESDAGIKPFSIRSAFWIILISIAGSWVIPLILSFAGIKTNLGVLIGNTFFTSFGFVWVRHFIDSKEGFTRSFWKQYVIFSIIFGLISYFWLFRKNYI